MPDGPSRYPIPRAAWLALAATVGLPALVVIGWVEPWSAWLGGLTVAITVLSGVLLWLAFERRDHAWAGSELLPEGLRVEPSPVEGAPVVVIARSRSQSAEVVLVTNGLAAVAILIAPNGRSEVCTLFLCVAVVALVIGIRNALHRWCITVHANERTLVVGSRRLRVASGEAATARCVPGRKRDVNILEVYTAEGPVRLVGSAHLELKVLRRAADVVGLLLAGHAHTATNDDPPHG